MNEYLWQYVTMVDPFATENEIAEIRELNEWDLLIVFHSGRKVILDRFTGYHKNIFYKDINELTEEQEKREFAYRLRSLMGRKGISQDRLAEMINTSQVMISRYVRGETMPGAIVLRKIAKALDYSMDDFFYREF